MWVSFYLVGSDGLRGNGVGVVMPGWRMRMRIRPERRRMPTGEEGKEERKKEKESEKKKKKNCSAKQLDGALEVQGESEQTWKQEEKITLPMLLCIGDYSFWQTESLPVFEKQERKRGCEYDGWLTHKRRRVTTGRGGTHAPVHPTCDTIMSWPTEYLALTDRMGIPRSM
jgi:hypothetical protein